MIQNSPFCAVSEASEQRSMPSNALANIRLDGFPVSQGHLWIDPNRYAVDWFDLIAAEQKAIMELIEQGKHLLEARYQPGGYNIGMNCGTPAGQTFLYVHCHLIPSYAGDQQDPCGGVRLVIPEKTDYWSGR